MTWKYPKIASQPQSIFNKFLGHRLQAPTGEGHSTSPGPTPLRPLIHISVSALRAEAGWSYQVPTLGRQTNESISERGVVSHMSHTKFRAHQPYLWNCCPLNECSSWDPILLLMSSAFFTHKSDDYIRDVCGGYFNFQLTGLRPTHCTKDDIAPPALYRVCQKVIPLVQCSIISRGITFLAHPVSSLVKVLAAHNYRPPRFRGRVSQLVILYVLYITTTKF